MFAMPAWQSHIEGMKSSAINTNNQAENNMNNTCPTHGNTLILSMSGGGVCLFCNHNNSVPSPQLEAPQLSPKSGV